jgi:hypothetical protein
MKKSKKPAGGENTPEKPGELPNIAWHPAFVEALQMELEDYLDFLEFFPEYQLSAEPLRIDCVIIKKVKDVVIKKNIAAIFREVNLLEYKSPDDYVSVDDFHKVCGYTFLYAALEKVPITGLTVSFVESRYPRELISHLKKVWGLKVEESCPGIYTVNRDILPIQIIDSRRLSADENLWLKSLSNRLDSLEIKKIGDRAAQKDKAARIQAYLNVIAMANAYALREAAKMRKDTLTLEQVFEEVGWAAKWEARGEARGETSKAIDIAKNMIALGFPAETIISATKLEPEKVNDLYPEVSGKAL